MSTVSHYTAVFLLCLELALNAPAYDLCLMYHNLFTVRHCLVKLGFRIRWTQTSDDRLITLLYCFEWCYRRSMVVEVEGWVANAVDQPR